MSLPKVLLMLLVWLIYTFVTYKGCIEQCCADGTNAKITKVVSDSVETPAERYALDFKWDNPVAFTNDGFDALKEKILAGKTDDNILQITGLYFEDEKKPEDFANMGFARADNIKKLFADGLPEDRIRTRARLEEASEGVRTNPFESALFSWIEAEKKEKTVELEELKDRVIIRFPSNSTTRNADPAIDEYLEKLAARVKTTGEKISITGHADSQGSENANRQLSKKRAEMVQRILLEKGVSKEQVTIDYKGETQPVAGNDTKAGRQENRRAEVRLIKQ